jgi:hypothetical protein
MKQGGESPGDPAQEAEPLPPDPLCLQPLLYRPSVDGDLLGPFSPLSLWVKMNTQIDCGFAFSLCGGQIQAVQLKEGIDQAQVEP